MFFGQFRKAFVFACAAMILVACDSAEERAEKHFESGMSLLEQGDVDRAIVEFRNVLSLNEFHREARAAYAGAVLDKGNLSEAYSQFLRLAEEDPNDMASRIELARMAISVQNWEEAERHAGALREANVDLDGTEVIDAIMRYRAAVLDRDDALQAEVAQEIEALSAENPNDTNLLRVLIEVYANRGDQVALNAAIDQAISVAPDELVYYRMKATTLAQNDDFEGLEAHLRVMLERFPEERDVGVSLVRLLVASGQLERAEEFLRGEISASENPLEVHVGLVAFLREVRGEEAALAEIDNAIGLYEDAGVMLALRAGILYDQGERATAISEMQAAIDGREPSARTDQLKIGLAKMLLRDGNEVGARTLVGEVLENDSGNVEALKMSSQWQIEADETDAAISGLRLALDQAPEDTEVMSLLATAHERAGEFEIAQDLLAMAAETSNYAPDESARFARALIDKESLRSAEDVLVNALRQRPGDLNLLRLLADVYFASEDWNRLSDVENSLRRDGSPAAVAAANTLRLQILSATQGREQAASYLESLAEDDSLGIRPRLSLLASRIEDGNAEAALALAQELAEENSADPRAQLIIANTHLGLSQMPEAEAVLQDIVEATPEFDQAWVQLIRAQAAQGKREEAEATIEQAVAAAPDSLTLLWAKATFLEQAGDIDGAIGIYEDIYAINSNSPIIANNLASLLATYRDDDESLERAYTIGRRLRGTDIAPFQDTWGWILFRRGEIEESITYLEPAARGIPNDPIVQYHLARAYQAAGRQIKALEQYRLVIEIAGDQDARPQIQRTLEEIAKLEAAQNSE